MKCETLDDIRYFIGKPGDSAWPVSAPAAQYVRLGSQFELSGGALFDGGFQRPVAKVRLVPELYFDERIARSYEARWPELFEPTVVDPAVNLLNDLSRTGAALNSASVPGGSRYR